MPASEFKNIRQRLREAIRDAAGLLWSDDELDDLINEAQREYALLSGALIGSVEVTSGRSSVCACPVDFIEVVRFIDGTGHELPIHSWKYLHDLYPDFRKITGSELRCLCFDFDGYGKYRLFPKIPSEIQCGTLHYKRLPTQDRIETRNMEALEQHSLYQVFFLLGKDAAAAYYNRFVAAVNEETATGRGLRARSIRSGRYF